MADIVGLRFVTTGEKDAIQAYERYKRGLLDLDQVQNKHVAAFNRRAREERAALQATARAAEQAARQQARAIQQQDAEARKALQNRLRYDREKEQAAARAARAAEQAARQQARAIQQQDAEARRAFQQYLRYQQEKERAAERAAREIEQAAEREARAQRQAAQETARLAAETEALARAYNPVRAATIAYERQVEQLTRAQEVGVLTSDQLRNKLGQLRAAYGRVGQDADLARQFTNQFGAVTQIAGIKTNRFGMVAQQVGYQVGDFFVQIQSGTNAFVAFGQQATQLAGLLPGLAGAVVGISISVGTMLLGAWDRARRAQDEAAASVKNLQTELESLDQTLQNWVRTKKASEMGVTVEELIGAEGLDKAIADLEKAQQGLVPGQAQVLQNLARRGFAGLQEAENMFAYRSEEVEAYLEALRRVFELQKKINSESISSLEERVSIEARALELMKVEAAYGSDSIQLLRAKNALELETLQAKLEQEIAVGGVTAEERRLVDAILDAVRQQNEMSEAIHESENATGGLADGLDRVGERARAAARGVMGILAALRSTMAELRAQEAGIAAAQRAAGRGMSENQVRIVQAGATVEAQLAAQGITGPEAASAVAQAQAAERLRLENERRQTAIFDAFNTGGGGGGGAAREQEDYLAGLLAEAEQKRRLVGLDEEETRRREILFELKKRDLLVNDALSEQQALMIEQIVQEEAQKRRLMETEQQREQLMQTIEGNIKSAFMSMVDGSQSVEDAFRNMLRNIILAIYEQKVATPAATAIGGLLEGLFNANGNVFSGGSRVTAYANGGVVNSPTYFPMSSGVGLMGEAGPEAIMPLKRGANGKLGVQVDGDAGNVTVVQNFNIAANGDDSVRRIVRQEAPRMAEMAKAAVVDAKRRGGTYGRSF